MEDLLAQDTYACGTVRSNRKDLPPCAKNKLKQGEKVYAQRGKLVFTKWHKKRDVSFLSTNVLPSEAPCIVQRRKNGWNINIKKPHVANVYTANMGGVDCANQLRSFYFAGYSLRKWYRYIFWFLFNLSVRNGFILESTSRADQGKQKRLMISFRLDLAKQLIDGFSWRKIKQSSQETPHHPVARRKTCLSSCGWTEEKMCSVYQSRAKNTQRIQDRDMLWV